MNNAQSHLPPEQPKAAEGTLTTLAVKAVKCSALLLGAMLPVRGKGRIALQLLGTSEPKGKNYLRTRKARTQNSGPVNLSNLVRDCRFGEPGK